MSATSISADHREISEAVANCATEPIHIPGSIQPHGFLLTARENDGTIEHASENARELLGIDRSLPGEKLAEVLPGVRLNGELGANPAVIDQCQLNARWYQAITHRVANLRVVEFERLPDGGGDRSIDLYALVTRLVNRFTSRSLLQEIAQHAVSEIQALTGFDRVLLYQFEKNWDGRVIAESRNEELPAYLNHRFPASDIPPQARELYRVNRVRIIPDANYIPVPIQAQSRSLPPLDMSFCVLRSVSPVHLEYMRNMGTMSSMSISVLREGELWGLISCHNRTPKRVPFVVRNACDIVTQICSAQMAAADRREETELRIGLKSSQTLILAYMAEAPAFYEGLKAHPEALLACTGSKGAAVLHEDNCYRFGAAPKEQEIRDLADWIRNTAPDEVVFSSAYLSDGYPAAADFANVAAGVIAVRISALHNSFVMWFRPELPQTVTWAGNPTKPVEHRDGQYRLSPRASFETWKETVRLRSLPWLPGEVESARELRDAIVGIVLQKAEELAQVTESLRLSNQELEAFSYSVSHDLRAPFRHIVGYAELLREREAGKLSDSSRRYIETIIESGHFAGALVDNLLSFSQIGRASLNLIQIDTVKLVNEVIKEGMIAEGDRQVDWRIGRLAPMRADLFMMRLVFQNLLSNALKYSKPRDTTVIEIDSSPSNNESIFSVRDNGVGFDSKYADKLFGVFQRLHRMEEFSGTGIGLANVRRIVSRHGGRTWGEGEIDRGATFYFSIPNRRETDSEKTS